MVKKSKCPHTRVYHERGRKVLVYIWDFDDLGGRKGEVVREARVVVEVCEKCGKKRELSFKEEVG